MKSFDLISPEGTKDLIMGDCAAVREVEERLHKIFRSGGYSEVITPGLEFYDVFNQKSRYFPQESMYKLTDTKGRLLVVRPDSTMPIARVVSTRFREQPLPLRLYYSQNVFRNKPVMRGRSDEIRQTGIELIGSASRRADIEVISSAIKVLASCESENFRLEIGHIGFFKELASALGADSDTIETIRSFIEVKNYPALNDLLDSFGDNAAAKALKQLPRLFGGIEVFDAAAGLFRDEKTEKVLSELKYIYTSICKAGYEGKITIDLGLVNKMDYYTGIVIKGYLTGFGDAVISGGRYDKLLSEYGYDVPATGYAVNVDAVAKVIRMNKDYTPASADVIVFGEDGYETEAVLHCEKLSENGQIAENSVFDSYEETVSYAKAKGIRTVVSVGSKITKETM
ncbi:MAG: ATP phosphoribosyltransferase regulatory subunit [Oscillospiraceae bacterium]|nr:ATP phosphoribosyltransferase regulatory subunit [Oscillospiraceae bacterium]